MRKLLLLMGFIGLMFSCKKTVDGENKNWEYNIKTASTMKATYPQFKEAIQKQVEEATGQMESANKISSEEERIKAMASANTTITAGLVGELQEFERNKSSLESTMRTLGQKSKTERDDLKVDRAIDDARDAMRRAEKMIASEPTSDAAEAQTRVRRANTELKTSLDFVKDIASRLDRKNDSKDKNKNNSDNGGSNSSTADGEKKSTEKVKEKPEDKLVKCEHCGTTVKFGNGKCSGCGAPLKL